jgi:hypothetical protein
MFEPRRWPREAWFPIVAGLLCLWSARHANVLFLLSVAPGLLLVAGGGSTLLWPGDQRIPHFTALGAVFGVLFGLLGGAWLGWVPALLVVASSAAAFVAAGATSVSQGAHVADVPLPEPSLRLSARVAVDEAVMASLQAWMRFPSGDDARRVHAEVEQALALFEDRGWLEKPQDYHPQPPRLESPQIERARLRGVDYERVSFTSGYEPHAQEPGRDRYLGFEASRRAHAWVLRHAGVERPWLVCIHGFRMGSPRIDLGAFDPREYHQRLGLNLLVPVLPLHGPRKVGLRSGDRFMDGDVLDTIHAEAQAMWDLRRMLSWIRASGAPSIGVLGLSLGGYNAALIASLESDLACAIAGIPLADMARIFWHHGPELHVRHAESLGLRRDALEAVFRPVSPMAMEPRVPRERRAIFAGVCDRIVPVEMVRDLWDHWERPAIEWYQGGHLSFPSEPGVRALVRRTLREAGLSDA